MVRDDRAGRYTRCRSVVGGRESQEGQERRENDPRLIFCEMVNDSAAVILEAAGTSESQ